MYPPDLPSRLYASGARGLQQKIRGKKGRLDNAVAGSSKSQDFFVTTTAGEDETSEANPRNSSGDAVDRGIQEELGDLCGRLHS